MSYIPPHKRGGDRGRNPGGDRNGDRWSRNRPPENRYLFDDVYGQFKASGGALGRPEGEICVRTQLPLNQQSCTYQHAKGDMRTMTWHFTTTCQYTVRHGNREYTVRCHIHHVRQSHGAYETVPGMGWISGIDKASAPTPPWVLTQVPVHPTHFEAAHDIRHSGPNHLPMGFDASNTDDPWANVQGAFADEWDA